MKKSQSLLTALFFLFLQTSNAQTIQGIKFENYAIKVSKAKKAKIDYASHSKGKLFKTAITEGYRESGVNFGGHYVCTFWGSGQGMTGGVMVDILTGKIYSLPLTEDNSYRQTYHNDNKNIFYHANSNLFVCNRNEPNAKNDDLVNLYYYFYEWDDKAKKFSLVTKKNVIEPFSNTPVSYNTLPHTLSILVKNNGDIMLSGKKVSIDNLKRDVQNALVKKAIVPDEIPIKYESEVLTDIRGEVETEVNSAIAGAKWLKKNKSTVAAKSVTTKSVATKSTATTPSVMVDKKGDVTLSGKKIPFNESDPVDQPISPYALTKKSCELLNYNYFHLYNLSIINLRFFTVYGPRQRPDLAIHKFFDLIYNEKPIQLFGDGKTGRDYTFVNDTVQGICSSVDRITSGQKLFETYNLGNSKPVLLKDLIEDIENVIGKKAIRNYLPMQDGDVDLTFADITQAKQMLGYSPSTPLREGLLKFKEWFDNKLVY